MILLVHKIASWFLRKRLEQMEAFMREPHATQETMFRKLISRGRDTVWGTTYGFKDIDRIDTFRERVPISSYEQLFPFIERAFNGEENVLWPGRTDWFAKSSGTTNDKSKYIPVSEESLEDCHYRAGQDMVAVYLDQNPESKLFTGKSLSIGGSHTIHQLNKFARYGDISAVILENLPRFFELMRAPSKEVALMDNWEEKLVAMANEVKNEDITGIVGVPTWTLVLINYLFELKGITSRNLLEIWPNLELYLHGGVSFEPYRSQFQQLIPSESMHYMDCYNASEGFFAFQHGSRDRDMLLLLDYGIFYEFVPAEHAHEEHPVTHTLEEVELGRNYAMVISTNAGLWRYAIGDTVCFTSKSPYKIKVTGRTKHFINAFGEELMVDNAETAITRACQETQAVVDNYTAAPIYLKGNKQGGHEWLIEFNKEPDSLHRFTEVLDLTLQSLNSDYEAKRAGDLALLLPTIRSLPQGTFHQWMKKRGKLGGQHKVPRLANNRNYVEDILKMMAIQ